MTPADIAALVGKLRTDLASTATCRVTGATFRPAKDNCVIRAERREAASALETLSARVAELEGERDEALKHADEIWKGSALRRTIQEMERNAGNAVDRAEAAEAEVARLRHALTMIATDCKGYAYDVASGALGENVDNVSHK